MVMKFFFNVEDVELNPRSQLRKNIYVYMCIYIYTYIHMFNVING